MCIVLLFSSISPSIFVQAHCRETMASLPGHLPQVMPDEALPKRKDDRNPQAAGLQRSSTLQSWQTSP